MHRVVVLPVSVKHLAQLAMILPQTADIRWLQQLHSPADVPRLNRRLPLQQGVFGNAVPVRAAEVQNAVTHTVAVHATHRGTVVLSLLPTYRSGMGVYNGGVSVVFTADK